MVNYENAKIYKLVCNKTGMIYIGSTCQRLLCKRLSGHVSAYNHWNGGKTNSYVTSFKIIEGGDYYMELLETVPCSSFDELAKKERHFIESIDCVNKQIPGRTKLEYDKHYKEVNIEMIRTKSREYQQNNKENIKVYKQNNKEKIKAYMKQYDNDNKGKRRERVSVKVKCSKCGCEVRKDSFLRHLRSLKCQNATDILQELDEITK